VQDQTLAGRTVVLELQTLPLEGALKQPTRFAPSQRVEGVITKEAPYIETEVFPFTSARVSAVLIDGRPAEGAAAVGNKGAPDCR
jgi:hypothetical protein